MSTTYIHESQSRHWKADEVKIIGDCAVRFKDVCVHEFNVGDVEDPEIYAAGPIYDWERSEAGQWVMSNAVDKPYYIKELDYNSWGHRYKIMARLSEQHQTFWTLKWNNK